MTDDWLKFIYYFKRTYVGMKTGFEFGEHGSSEMQAI